MATFLNTYILHKSTEDIVEKYSKDGYPKRCRFCGLDSSQATFNTIPHIIPELFGRNNITSNFECDSCNKKFQPFESDVSTMIQHYLTLIGIKTKNGIPTFQSDKTENEKSTVIKTIGDKRDMNFGNNLKDFTNDTENSTLKVNFRTRKFRPFSIYKIFLKIGISLLSDTEIRENGHFIDLLNSKEPVRNGMQVYRVFRYMLKTKYRVRPQANLYRAKDIVIGDKEYPEYILVISFANVAFQFFMPISAKNMATHLPTNRLILELYPSFVFEELNRISKVDMVHFDLDETSKVSFNDEITFHYDKSISDSLDDEN